MLLTILQISEELTLSDLEVTQRVISKLLFRLIIDLVSVTILIKGLYQQIYKRKELFFTFFTFNLVIFLICFLLNKVDMSLGAAFGLFAVFSMLRYKTEEISLKDMSYLFLSIAIGLISAVAKIKGANEYYEYALLVVINALILGISYLIEHQSNANQEKVQVITYDQLNLIKPENESLLIEDLKNRTGLKIHRVTWAKLDLTKNQVQVKIYFYD